MNDKFWGKNGEFWGKKVGGVDIIVYDFDHGMSRKGANPSINITLSYDGLARAIGDVDARTHALEIAGSFESYFQGLDNFQAEIPPSQKNELPIKMAGFKPDNVISVNVAWLTEISDDALKGELESASLRGRAGLDNLAACEMTKRAEAIKPGVQRVLGEYEGKTLSQINIETIAEEIANQIAGSISR